MPWGELLLVECKVSDISDYVKHRNIIPTVQRMVSTPGWQDELSSDYSNANSSTNMFYAFKIHELYESIKNDGVMTPFHIHMRTDGQLAFHPSNNKIQVMLHFFPDYDIKILYHRYNFLDIHYENEHTDWYKKFTHTKITSEQQYRDLFKLSIDADLEFHCDFMHRVLDPEIETTPKLNQKKVDWANLTDVEKENPLYVISPALTVTDRFHRIKMQETKRMGDIAIWDKDKRGDNWVEFCDQTFGKGYDIFDLYKNKKVDANGYYKASFKNITIMYQWEEGVGFLAQILAEAMGVENPVHKYDHNVYDVDRHTDDIAEFTMDRLFQRDVDGEKVVDFTKTRYKELVETMKKHRFIYFKIGMAGPYCAGITKLKQVLLGKKQMDMNTYTWNEFACRTERHNNNFCADLKENGADVCEVEYNELFDYPEGTLTRIAEWLDIDMDINHYSNQLIGYNRRNLAILDSFGKKVDKSWKVI